MKRYQIKSNLVSRNYKVGDIFPEDKFNDKRMLNYHLQRGNIIEIIDAPKQKRNRNEELEIEEVE